MKCDKCGIVNDPDAKFCKECGERLQGASSGLSSDESAKIGELIYAAYKHKEAGRIEEAMLACHAVLALNENNPAAHSLLGALYDAKGDIEKAIRHYERAVELNPSGFSDLQKLDRLRSMQRAEVYQVEPEELALWDRLKPYVPAASALAFFCIVFVLGFMAMRGSSPGSSAQSTTPGTGNSAQTTPPVQAYQQYGQQQQTQAVQNPQGVPVPAAPAQNQQATPADATARQSSASTNAGARQGASSPSSNYGNAPASKVTPSPIPPAKDEAPVIVPVTDQPAHTPPTPAPRPSPTPSASVVVHSPEPPADPEQRALQLQSEGKYQEAIAAYREALNRTSDTGRIHQKIAICQQRLGQKDAAIRSYTQAISSYRDQLAAGRDPAEVQRNIRACEAGIEACRQ